MVATIFCIVMFLIAVKSLLIGSDFNFTLWYKYRKHYTTWYLNRPKYVPDNKWGFAHNSSDE